MNADGDSSNAPNSSRGSTRFTGEVDEQNSMHIEDEQWMLDEHRRQRELEEQEEERAEDGSLNLTKKYLRELLKTEWRKYYRTPHLNEKLYLHYKGFHKIANLAQFSNLKCLYFEGNGCDSLLGLEENTALRSLFIQENVIEVIEGLDNMKDLKQINLNDNIIKKVTGLSGCTSLETIHLKSNRLG